MAILSLSHPPLHVSGVQPMTHSLLPSAMVAQVRLRPPPQPRAGMLRKAIDRSRENVNALGA
eukprot:2376339-Rhodomonas_salina.1